MVNIILKYLEQPLKAYMPYLDVVDSPVIRLASGKIYKGSGSEKQEVCISDSVGNALYVRQTQPETFRELKALSSCNKQYQVNARCRALFYTFGTNDFKVSEDKVKSGLQAALNKINFNQYTGTSTDIVITINSASFDAEKLFKDETGVDFSGNEWPIIVAVDFTLSYNDVNCNSCDIEDIENPFVWVPDVESQNCENKAVCDVVSACPVIITLQSQTASLQEQIDNLPYGFSCEDLPSCQTIIDIQTELNEINSDLGLKEDESNKVINFNSPDNTKYPTTQATKNLVDYYIQSNIKIIGDWDASSGSYPLADESNTTPFIAQWGATIKAGWAFRVGYGQSGIVDGYDYENGDVVYALVDSPANVSADWGDLDHNLQQANESLRGTAKIITAAIIEDETTLDDEKIVTGKKLWANFWARVLALPHTFAAKLTLTSAPRFNSTTANQRLEVDANKDLVSVAKGSADNKNFGENIGDVMRGEEIFRMKSPFFTTTTVDHTTNTTAASAVFSQLIPAGKLKAGDVLRVQFKLLRISGTGSAWTRIYTSPTVALGTRIAQSQSATNGNHSVITRNFRLAPNGLELTAISGAIAFATDENVLTNNTNELTYSFNVNVDNYFHIAVEKSVGTDVYRLYYVYSQIIRP